MVVLFSDLHRDASFAWLSLRAAATPGPARDPGEDR